MDLLILKEKRQGGGGPFEKWGKEKREESLPAGKKKTPKLPVLT